MAKGKKNKITQVTVEQLFMALGKEIEKGNGNKYLIAADDNEGNGYHGVFHLIEDANDIDDWMIGDTQVSDKSQLMVIG